MSIGTCSTSDTACGMNSIARPRTMLLSSFVCGPMSVTWTPLLKGTRTSKNCVVPLPSVVICGTSLQKPRLCPRSGCPGCDRHHCPSKAAANRTRRRRRLFPREEEVGFLGRGDGAGGGERDGQVGGDRVDQGVTLRGVQAFQQDGLGRGDELQADIV